ncbi:hypothetical protein QCA50_007872 [Cerrena zonata]|uniref:DUF2421 domain-containing protein n=1 Tax=Cerrena zonata TaxID=2478898 RepID=A0AAW0G748_9APHY
MPSTIIITSLTFLKRCTSKRSLARLLSTFLCSLAIVITPFSSLGGNAAFLVLALKELVFSVQENLAQQLESTVLNIMGALFGIGLSTLAKYIASLYEHDSINGRACCATFLIAISFFAGLIKSRLPRLQLSTRISCFVSVWLLTTNIGDPSRVLSDSGAFLWIALTAAIICLLSLMIVMLIIHWVPTNFEQEVASTFSLLHESTSLALRLSFSSNSEVASPSPNKREEYRTLHHDLLTRCIKLNESSSQAAFEIRIGRLSLRSIRPLVGIIEHLRRELAWGMSLTTQIDAHKSKSKSRISSPVISPPPTPSQNTLTHAIGPNALSLGYALTNSMKCIESTICLVFQRSSTSIPRPVVHKSERDESWITPQLAVIHEADERLVAARDAARELLRGIFEDFHMVERVAQNKIPAHKESYQGSVAIISLLQMAQEMRHALQIASNLVHLYKIRSRSLWNLNRGLKRSGHHFGHALKSAVGVALLTLPAFLPEDSSGRKWFNANRGQWATISYLWVLETNTGATWRTGYLRILGTIFGAVYAYITWAICRTNAYGLVILVTAADIPVTWLITRTTLGPLATPLSVAIPPIVFAQYTSGDTSISIIHLAILRALMISAGMLAALLVNSLVFPRHCRVLFLSDTSRALSLLSNLYLTLSHEMFHSKHAYPREERRKTPKLELEIRNALYRLSALIVIMKNELGLIPKPLRMYRRVVTVIQKILDLLTGLRKIRENIPRKEAVSNVFRERREFMSCVCITLFACQHAFRTREPLPQFLPSVRHAFDSLETHIYDSLLKAQAEDPHAMGMSLVYAFAEQEVMRNMVNALEELVELTGRLFGTSTWLQEATWTTTMEQSDSAHGWYSAFNWEV